MNATLRLDRETLTRATRAAEARLAYRTRPRPASRRPDGQSTDEADREVEILGR